MNESFQRCENLVSPIRDVINEMRLKQFEHYFQFSSTIVSLSAGSMALAIAFFDYQKFSEENIWILKIGLSLFVVSIFLGIIVHGLKSQAFQKAINKFITLFRKTDPKMKDYIQKTANKDVAQQVINSWKKNFPEIEKQPIEIQQAFKIEQDKFDQKMLEYLQSALAIEEQGKEIRIALQEGIPAPRCFLWAFRGCLICFLLASISLLFFFIFSKPFIQKTKVEIFSQQPIDVSLQNLSSLIPSSQTSASSNENTNLPKIQPKSHKKKVVAQ